MLTWDEDEPEAPSFLQSRECVVKRDDEWSDRLQCGMEDTRCYHGNTSQRHQRRAVQRNETKDEVEDDPHRKRRPDKPKTGHYNCHENIISQMLPFQGKNIAVNICFISPQKQNSKFTNLSTVKHVQSHNCITIISRISSLILFSWSILLAVCDSWRINNMAKWGKFVTGDMMVGRIVKSIVLFCRHISLIFGMQHDFSLDTATSETSSVW